MNQDKEIHTLTQSLTLAYIKSTSIGVFNVVVVVVDDDVYVG